VFCLDNKHFGSFTACHQSIPLPVPDAPLKVLHPLPVVSLEISLWSRSYPPFQCPKSGPYQPRAPPHPRPLIPAQKCDTGSPICGPCSRSRANLECSYDPTGLGPHPLPLQRGQACLPCRCVIPHAPFPYIYRTWSLSRKKKVNQLFIPTPIPPVYPVCRHSDVMALGLHVPPACAPRYTSTVCTKTHLPTQDKLPPHRPPVPLSPQEFRM